MQAPAGQAAQPDKRQLGGASGPAPHLGGALRLEIPDRRLGQPQLPLLLLNLRPQRLRAGRVGWGDGLSRPLARTLPNDDAHVMRTSPAETRPGCTPSRAVHSGRTRRGREGREGAAQSSGSRAPRLLQVFRGREVAQEPPYPLLLRDDRHAVLRLQRHHPEGLLVEEGGGSHELLHALDRALEAREVLVRLPLRTEARRAVGKQVTEGAKRRRRRRAVRETASVPLSSEKQGMRAMRESTSPPSPTRETVAGCISGVPRGLPTRSMNCQPAFGSRGENDGQVLIALAQKAAGT